MKKKIFDCFLYDGEKELLKLRFDFNYRYVYKFVLVQSKWTFQGKKSTKELISIDEISSWKKEFKSKVEIINLDKSDFSNTQFPYQREIISRGAFERSFKKLSDDNLIMISDVDEIIDCKKLLRSKLNNNYIYRLNLYFTYFSSNNLCISAPWWASPIVFSYSLYKKNDLDISMIRPVGKVKTKIPFYIKAKNLYFLGIHLSFLGGFEAALRKLTRYSDSPIDLEEFSYKYYSNKIKKGEDIFKRKLIWQIIDIDILFLDKRLLKMISRPFFLEKKFTSNQNFNKFYLKIYLKLLTFSENIFYRKVLYLIYKNIT